MDPITAVSLASNVISFIDFTTQLLRGAKNIRAAGDFEENASLEAVTRHIDIFITKLLGPESSSLVGSDLQLSDLAAKCRALAIELLALLYKIKAKDPNSRRQAVWSVMKNMKYEEQKKSLEARLASCRDQFEMQLNFLASQENRLKLHAVLSSSQSSAHQIQEISASLDRLRDTMQVAGFSDQAKMQLSQLLRVSDDIVHAVAQERILRGLAYESARSLNERHDMIPEAHFKTFEWLVSKTADNKDKQVDFSPPPSDFSVSDASSYGSDSLVFEEEEDEGDDILAEFSKDWKQFHHSSLKADVLRSPFKCFDDSVSQIGQELRSARKLFMNWLSSGEGIFHFSAKFGAGKSTLMKFLCAHPDVQSELEAWSRTCNRRLVIGSYFFYNLGTTYQKSLAGMCRTLVYEVLELCPDLTSWILPAQWSQASSTPWQVDQTIRISDREALQAFERIIEGAATDKTQARFCFFIDGLDELEKTAEVSHGDLVNLLHDWHRRSSGHVKFCVSSREHNVFMNGFSASQRVRLHTLTRQDLELFARDKLRGIQDNATMNQIVEAILDKAQGIFFWVTLVVRNMQTRLEDGFGPDEILEQIDVLPSEVNDLFAYILDSLDTWAKSRAYRTLAILLEATRWDIEVPALGSTWYLNVSNGIKP
ncbi:hypothetical protein CkaCkLH20_03136 [Colletotrichum karsti]|uniref:Nephrocystin 3-like N-terminal domain-containing protein n=1 Tax=Colletotrichum karsti TaxID=1095194 RepID=A0A9P6I9E0_9PEZI|nr:uncharacterized protein CkaCkLH20_03136 [Colletotrichum karsti]KAF9879593.1 hypothetical protein CkaCkLH20_03136 [Colletotrichum karsti]